MPKDQWREIGAMSGPVFIEQLAMALIAMLVSMLVKRTGLAAVAAVNLLNTLNILFQQIYVAIGVAVTVTVAQHRGRGDLESTGKTAAQSNTLSLAISTLMAVLCFLFMNPILHLILEDSEPLVYTYSGIYLLYNILSLPFMSIYSIATAAIRGSGYPKLSLVATLINNGANAVLAIIAVMCFDAGLVGVSVAMLLSRIFAAVAGLVLLKRGNENMKIEKLFPLRFEKKIIQPVITVSIPICLENLLFQAGKMVTQTYAVPFGTNAIAVNGIASNINTLLCVGGMTASNAVTPIVGRYIGMRDFKTAKEKLYQFLYLSILVATASAVLIFVLIPPLARFYTELPAVQAEILYVTGYSCLAYPLLWCTSFVTPAGLRGAGDVRFTTYIAILSMVAIRVVVGYVLAIVLKMGVQGIWLGMYADWVLRSICFLWRARGDKWLQKSII